MNVPMDLYKWVNYLGFFGCIIKEKNQILSVFIFLCNVVYLFFLLYDNVSATHAFLEIISGDGHLCCFNI